MDTIIFNQAQQLTNSYIDQNDSDFSAKTNPNYDRQSLQDKIFDNLNNTDWEQEAKYFNHYFVNGKVNMGRTIKCKRC